jgi:hypothetical protein
MKRVTFTSMALVLALVVLPNSCSLNDSPASAQTPFPSGSNWHRPIPSGHEWSGPVSTECSGETLAQWTPEAFFTTPGTNIKVSADQKTGKWASTHEVYVLVEDRKGERVFFDNKGLVTATKGHLLVIRVCQGV